MEDDCAICLEKLNNPDNLDITLSCNHKFHRNCMIYTCRNMRGACPLCRNELLSDDLNALGISPVRPRPFWAFWAWGQMREEERMRQQRMKRLREELREDRIREERQQQKERKREFDRKIEECYQQMMRREKREEEITHGLFLILNCD